MRLPKTLTTLLGAGAFFLSSLFSPKADAQTYYPPLDAKINPFRQPNQVKPLVWDTLSTREQRENLIKQYFAEDKTDTITYILGKFESGNFAMQAHLNFYGAEIVSGDTTFPYDITNLGEYNTPLYTASISAPGFGHGITTIALGDNLKNFHSWGIFEPQTDSSAKIGDWNLPENCTFEVKQTYFYNENGKNMWFRLPFLTFNIVEGVPTLASYDTTRLVLERNFAPENFKMISPANGAQFPSCKDSINFTWTKSKDRDPADIVKYKLRVRNKDTGLETIFSDITDTTNVFHSTSWTKGNYEGFVESNDGKEAAYSDTSNFSIRNTAPTTSSFTAPVNNETVNFDKGKLKLKYTPSTDADMDPLTRILRFQRIDTPGLDTLVTTMQNDSMDVDSRIFDPLARYRLEGKVTDGTDTVSFTSPLEFSTPTVTGVEKLLQGTVPEKYDLNQNYPNPFNPETKIRYSIEKPGMVSLKVYNMLGQEVETLVGEHQFRGTYEADFSASKLPSGVYMYRLQSGDFIETKKMVVNK